jgi:hypothetical protein
MAAIRGELYTQDDLNLQHHFKHTPHLREEAARELLSRIRKRYGRCGKLSRVVGERVLDQLRLIDQWLSSIDLPCEWHESMKGEVCSLKLFIEGGMPS